MTHLPQNIKKQNQMFHLKKDDSISKDNAEAIEAAKATIKKAANKLYSILKKVVIISFILFVIIIIASLSFSYYF